jgi:DNA-directed RNA polymerase specialized sigma subunit
MVRSEAEVERLVSENQTLVHLVVNRFLKKYFMGTMEREDLVSRDLIGLVQAARFWDLERGGARRGGRARTGGATADRAPLR